MPLTPEDVANKQFTSTRLKPGYDETEVDEFLDEVEAELTRLYRENDDLRNKLVAAQRAVAEGGEASRAPAPPPPPPQPMAQAPAPAPVQRAPAPVAAENPSATATGILALAQRTAEEHVAEARSQAERIVSEARARADGLQREIDERHRQMVGSLESERSSLEHRVQELRTFERDYRTRLKAYLENQLRELESRETAAPPERRTPEQQPGSPVTHLPSAGGPQPRQHAQQPPQSGPSRSPFAPGAPLGQGGDTPSGPPQQAHHSSGFAIDDGPDQHR